MKNRGDDLTKLLSQYDNCVVFLHNTREEDVAHKILAEGFRFENQLTHSSDRVNPSDPVEITYFMFQRKEYGNYTIIISIPRKTYAKYASAAHQRETILEEIISAIKPRLGDDDELVYIMPREHILGFFSLSSGLFEKNPAYDAGFMSTL